MYFLLFPTFSDIDSDSTTATTIAGGRRRRTNDDAGARTTTVVPDNIPARFAPVAPVAPEPPSAPSAPSAPAGHRRTDGRAAWDGRSVAAATPQGGRTTARIYAPRGGSFINPTTTPPWPVASHNGPSGPLNVPQETYQPHYQGWFFSLFIQCPHRNRRGSRRRPFFFLGSLRLLSTTVEQQMHKETPPTRRWPAAHRTIRASRQAEFFSHRIATAGPPHHHLMVRGASLRIVLDPLVPHPANIMLRYPPHSMRWTRLTRRLSRSHLPSHHLSRYPAKVIPSISAYAMMTTGLPGAP